MNTSLKYVGSELELFANATTWKRYLSRQLQPFVRGDILEVGAGIGSTTQSLRVIPHSSWTCLEPDSELCAALRSALSQEESAAAQPPVHVISGLLNDLDPAAKYDAILYIDVLEHIAEDKKELAKAAAFLKRGGCLVVLCPAHQWLFSPFDEAIGHFRRYSARSLLAAGPVSLELVRVWYLDCVGLLASLANRVVLRSRRPTQSQINVWDKWMVPMSMYLDPLSGFGLGKSVVAVWRSRENVQLPGSEGG